MQLWIILGLMATAMSDDKKSVNDCAEFSERENEDAGSVELRVTNRCEAKLSCGIKWTLTCAPGTKKAKKTRGAYAFELDDGQSDGTTVSTEQCGFDGWQIADVSWSCEPTR
jgi:hypothetical protein